MSRTGTLILILAAALAVVVIAVAIYASALQPEQKTVERQVPDAQLPK